MDSSKTTRNSSRRSSILKPPKPRQPLQNLNFNSSSNENSPTTTTKIKRRVSFAEKKHVKEFCNSLEQGTVWDNTYEEHDLSNLKAPCSSNQEECEIENVYQESICNNAQGNYVHFPYNGLIEKCLNIEDYSSHDTNIIENVNYQNEMQHVSLITYHDVISQDDKIVCSTDLQLKKDNHVSKNIIVYEDSDEKLPEKVSELSKSNVHNVDCNELNVTSLQVTCMDLTQIVGRAGLIPPLINAQNLQQLTNVINHNTSMELTEAIPSVIKRDDNIDNAKTAVSCLDDGTKNFNISMEITTAVPTTLYDLQPNANTISNCPPNLISNINNDNRTTIFHNASMDITEAVKTDIHISSDKSPVIKQIPQCKYDFINQNERTEQSVSMEMTEVVPVNVHSVTKIQEKGVTENNFKKLKYDTEAYQITVNFDGTKNFNNETVEFTTVLTDLPKTSQTPLQISMQNTSHTQSTAPNSVLGSYRNDNTNLMSNRSTIFHNNSMAITEVVSSFGTKDNCREIISFKTNIKDQELERSVMFPNISMEITEAVMPRQTPTQMKNLDVNSTKVKQLSENFENRGLTDLPADTYFLKNVTATIIPSSLKSNTILSKENDINNIHNSSKNIVSIPVEILSSANTESSMSLHESIQQEIYASALKENNMETACASSDFESIDSFSAIKSELKKNKHLSHEYTQPIVSHSRRTYVIQPSSTDRTFIVNTNENNVISEINSSTHYKLNDKESSAHNSLSDVDNLQSTEDCGIEYFMTKDMFFNENIDSIKPPSFLCLDEFSTTDTSMNVNNEQKISIETICLTESKINKHEDTLTLKDHQTSVLENVHKAQSYLAKCASMNDVPANSKLEQEDLVRIDEIQKLKVLDARDDNTEIHVLECSSSTINNTENVIMMSDVEDLQNLCPENSNLENQAMESLSSNVNANPENTPEVENNGKLTDTRTMKMDEEYSNKKLGSSLKPNVSYVEENNSVELDPFYSLINELKVRVVSNDIIWEIYHENIERKMFVIGFISCSLLVVIFLRDACDITSDKYIKEIKIISRLSDDADVLISIVHRIILEKLDTKKLMNSYKSRDDIFPMLEYVSEEVKLAMDFMFDLKRLNDINLMEITCNSVSFVSRTKRRETVLKVTVDIKPFEKIKSQNVSVCCLLGSVREDDIKKLITNIKKDHKFLRRYIKDVKDYIHLMEGSGNMIVR